MRTLNVQVMSGLGSRMFAVIAGIAWSKVRAAGLRIHWPRRDTSESLGEFPCWFSELFDSPFQECRLSGPENWPKQISECTGGWRIRAWSPECFISDGESDDLRIHTVPDGWPYTALWKPSVAVLEHVHSVTWPDGKVIGVHIRKTNAQPSATPVEWYVSRIREIQNLYSVSAIYLSCDHPQPEQIIRENFPVVVSQAKVPSTVSGGYRYDRTGIMREAADWRLLSRCDWMLGSYNSSFSAVAGWMRGGEYQPGWGREGWMAGGRYEDARTPVVGIEEALG